MVNCLHCGNTNPAPNKKGGNPRKYCSDVCRNAADWARHKAGPFSGDCQRCGKHWSNAKNKQKYCSYECRYSSLLDSSKEKHRIFREANPIPESFEYNCSICNLLIIKPHRLTGVSLKYGVYCDTCRLAAQRARYRKKTVARQSSAKPSGIWFEQILTTYGSNCYLCLQDIDLSLSRTSKRGATVDHIIPLSRGGQDELDNLRLVHWDCNRAKSNKLVEELNG